MNKRAKGNRLQRDVVRILKGWGYTVHNQCAVARPVKIKNRTIWVSKRNDIFGCIDIVAVRRGSRVRFIQVTADSGIGRKEKELRNVSWDFNFMLVEVWRYARRKKKPVWIIYRFREDSLCPVVCLNVKGGVA